MNGATFPPDSVAYDIIVVLICILLMRMTLVLPPRLWKRDVSKAFRRCPISVEHLDRLGWCLRQKDFPGFYNTWECYSGRPARCTHGINSGIYWSGSS